MGEKTYEECRRQAAAEFAELNQPGSAVRGLLESKRHNPPEEGAWTDVDQAEHDARAAQIFEEGLDESVQRLGEVAEMFSSPTKK
ncbi:hypothetical protein KTR10_00370 [Candidatus Kaiserbacteria bacterium]|nr:hypothetical protein [Candidatus Kaiserbacteria bacterium]